MNLRRNTVWLLPLLALLSAPLWWSEASRLLAPPATTLTRGTLPAQRLNTFVLQRVALTQNRAGHDELVVKAAEVQSGRSADELQMFEVEGQLIGERRSMRVTGAEACYDSARQVFTVSDQVRLATTDGYRMETEVLRYFPKYRKIKTAEAVNLDGSGISLQGQGLLYDLSTGEFLVGGRVVVDLS